MKRSIIAFITCMLATGAFSQEVKGDERLSNIDWEEDSVEIITVDDIIKGIDTYELNKSVKLTTYCARCIQN